MTVGLKSLIILGAVLLIIVTFLPADLRNGIVGGSVELLSWLLNDYFDLEPYIGSVSDNATVVANLISGIAHAIVFFVCGYLVAVYMGRFPVLYIMLVILVIAGGSEFLQSFAPGRNPRLADFAINFVSALCGCFVLGKAYSLRAYKAPV